MNSLRPQHDNAWELLSGLAKTLGTFSRQVIGFENSELMVQLEDELLWRIKLYCDVDLTFLTHVENLDLATRLVWYTKHIKSRQWDLVERKLK